MEKKLTEHERQYGRQKQGRCSQHPRRTKAVDWDQVKKLAGIQCTIPEIAGWFGFNPSVLYKAAEEVFDRPLKELISEWAKAGSCSLRRKQWLLADKSASMAIFLGKNYLGQSDKQDIDFVGDGGITIMHYGAEKPQPWIEANPEPAQLDYEPNSDPGLSAPTLPTSLPEGDG